MKLSEILNRYYVLPANQSELISFSTKDHPEHGKIIVISWTDSTTLTTFCQEFVDQEVDTDLGDMFHYKGQFNVTPIGDGGPVAFIALDTVPLSQPPVRHAIIHCDNCGCDWLDNGLNPIGCPYCKLTADTKILVAERDALEAKIERLHEQLRRETERRWEGNLRAAQEYVEDMRDMLKEAAQICKDLDDEAQVKEGRLACGAECAAAIADLAARMNVSFERV